MERRAGSAIVLAMLLLVLLSAAGMYAISLPVSPAGGARYAYPAAVARNMARAGAHAAIARLPALYSDAGPCVARITVGPEAAGRYAATSRRIGGGTAPAGGSPYEDFAVVSDGNVSGAFRGTFRVRAEVRIPATPADGGGRPEGMGKRPRILKWEETGPL